MGKIFGLDIKWLVPCLGGAMLLAHFMRIGYVPTLSLADLGVVLSALFLFALLALVGLVLALAVPAAMIGTLVNSHVLRAPRKYRGLPKKRKGLRSYRSAIDHPAVSKEDRAAHAKNHVLDMLPRFFGASILAALYLAGCILAMIKGYPAFGQRAMLGGFFLGMVTFLAITFVVDTSWGRWNLRRFRRTGAAWALLTLLYLGYWPLFLYAVILLPINLDGWFQWFFALLTALMLVFLHWIAYATRRAAMTFQLKLMLPSIFFVLVCSGLIWSAVDGAANRLGLGLMPNVQLTLTKKGCDIARAAMPEAICLPAPSSTADAYLLTPLDVLTRLGSDFYVTAPGGLRDDTRVRFLIPSAEVLSWKRLPKPAKSS